MVAFNGLGIVVTTPDGWEDISDLEGGLPPFLTLCKADGYGALQFSEGPADLNIPSTSQSLADWLCANHCPERWGPALESMTEDTPMMLAAATFKYDGEPMRIWALSNGSRSAIVHYTVEENSFNPAELAECEQIVRGIRFLPA